MADQAEEQDFFGLRNPRVGENKHLVPRNHIINASFLANGKGLFTECMPRFIEVKQSHKDF